MTTVSAGERGRRRVRIVRMMLTNFRYQKCIWDLIEHPESSNAANIVSYIAMSFVLVSTVVMSLNTMQGLKVMDKKGNLQPHPFLEIIEAICIAWFTLEFIIRSNSE